MFQKTVKLLKFTRLRHKQQPKRDLLKLMPSLLIQLALFTILVFQGFFFKNENRVHFFSFHSSFGVLILTVDILF